MITEGELNAALKDLREIRDATQKIAALLERAFRPVEIELSARSAGDTLTAFLAHLQGRAGASGDTATDTPA